MDSTVRGLSKATMVEGFSEALFYELSAIGVRVKVVEPGYGPGTAFTANSADRMSGLIPQGYQAYARQLTDSMQNPGLATTATQVADAILAAATDDTERLRYPAGPDSEQLAHARWRSSDEDFLTGMRSRFRMREMTG